MAWDLTLVAVVRNKSGGLLLERRLIFNSNRLFLLGLLLHYNRFLWNQVFLSNNWRLGVIQYLVDFERLRPQFLKLLLQFASCFKLFFTDSFSLQSLQMNNLVAKVFELIRDFFQLRTSVIVFLMESLFDLQ